MPVVHWRIDSLNKEFVTVHALIPLVTSFVPTLFSNVFTFNLFEKFAALIRTHFVIGHSWTRHTFHYVCQDIYYLLQSRSLPIIAISKGSVIDYRGAQREIIYLVSSTLKIVKAGCAWCFTDGHAIEAMTEYYNDLERLREIDWIAIAAWDYRPTATDPDKERKKQAEFLVYSHVPWRCVESITVIDIEMQRCIEEILNATHSQHRPNINIKRNWYHNPGRRQE